MRWVYSRSACCFFSRISAKVGNKGLTWDLYVFASTTMPACCELILASIRACSTLSRSYSFSAASTCSLVARTFANKTSTSACARRTVAAFSSCRDIKTCCFKCNSAEASRFFCDSVDHMSHSSSTAAASAMCAPSAGCKATQLASSCSFAALASSATCVSDVGDELDGPASLLSTGVASTLAVCNAACICDSHRMRSLTEATAACSEAASNSHALSSSSATPRSSRARLRSNTRTAPMERMEDTVL
mmetsp:Transcript_117509/g.292985  ORF Transcript_117509/g.292985 Transcript_117509/m.292985 type:complete len:247 (-) Transcript_117509:323-1063(-)